MGAKLVVCAPWTPPPAFRRSAIVSHPLVQHKLSILRDRETPTKIFKELVDEIAMLMAYEATSDLALEDAMVDTPLERTVGAPDERQRSSRSCRSCAPALGMVEGIYRLVPGARIGHIGLYRDHDTLEPVDYYFKVPGDAAERDFFLLDPDARDGRQRRRGRLVTQARRRDAHSLHVSGRRAGGRAAAGERRIPMSSCTAPSLDRGLNEQWLHPSRTWRRRRSPVRHATVQEDSCRAESTRRRSGLAAVAVLATY